MNERGSDRVTKAFLAAGPTVLADRVLDAAFEEVHRTRQRRVLWRAPWRFPTMNSFAKFAVAAVAVIAVGLLGLAFLKPGGTVGVGAPSVAPSPSNASSPTPTPTPRPSPSAPPLTGQFTSDRNGFSIAYPATWSTRVATAPWTSGYVDFGNEAGDVLYDPTGPADIFLAFASQPLAGRTPAKWEADAWQIVADDDPANAACSSTATPVTIDGAAGSRCGNVALVTDGGRGYFILLYTSGDVPQISARYDDAWFMSALATMQLHPEDAVDTPASPSASPS